MLLFPAIAPTSTHIDVTLNNPWYFRVTFHDNYQARFLANYAVKVLQKKQFILIGETQAYGAYISEIFKKKLNNWDAMFINSILLIHKAKPLRNNFKRLFGP
jgi:ABC-type branched-chain amino acid transport systems, periplasmic component